MKLCVMCSLVSKRRKCVGVEPNGAYTCLRTWSNVWQGQVSDKPSAQNDTPELTYCLKKWESTVHMMCGTNLLTYSMEQSPSWEANSKLCS
jgi:hypothetical protein